MENVNVIIVINSIALIISIIAIIVGSYQFLRQQRLAFFEKYTARYQHIIEIMPEKVFTDEALTTEEEEKAIRAIRMYIDLCSEEYYLFQNKYLDEKVWNEWKGGMKMMFTNSLVINVFETKYSKTYEEFAKFLKWEILHNNINTTNI